LVNGIIRIRTLVKFLATYSLAIECGRVLNVDEIEEVLGCSKSNAYNYLRTMKTLNGMFVNQLRHRREEQARLDDIEERNDRNEQ
jgi:hypothetical protein